MSIKKLFESTEKNKNYLTPHTEKTAFEDAESGRNIKEAREKQEHHIPQVDYSKPEKFARFGSAVLYYKSAFTRILDYYPYDGSHAEMNKFYNGCLDIEKYILDTLYPRTNGYIEMNKAGYGASAIADGYGRPTNYEYIDFKGGPGTGSVTTTSLKSLAINPHNEQINKSNIYDTDLYNNQHLPDNYGKGTRTSNLRANFDDGVTVEFWFKSGSISTSETHKQVLFDWWNNVDGPEDNYGRIIIELTSSLGSRSGRLNPFCVTVESGSNTGGRNILLLGSSSLWNDMGSWHHYAIRLKNSGSTLGAQLYVDGRAHDERTYEKYNLSGAFGPAIAPYQSSGSLQGWWKLYGSPGTQIDSSTHGRTGTYDAPANQPVVSAETPTKYVQISTCTFDGDADAGTGDTAVNIGTGALWDTIIGNDTANGSKQLMTFAAWIRPTGLGENNYGRILSFSTNGVVFYIGGASDPYLYFACVWNGSSAIWRTGADRVSLNNWNHVAVTYNANSTSNDPILYIDGVAMPISQIGIAPSNSWAGIPSGDDCYIGNNAATNRTFQGQIGDVAIWNSILTGKEILTLAQSRAFQTEADSITSLDPKGAVGRIGALITRPATTVAASGSGKLSGSLDEFRYWKVARSAKEIGENYFLQVRGGTNTDVSNTTLGVYYKFNEGITGNDSVDSSVLDYAGRVTNGVWTGYSAGARNIGSAMVSASAVTKEYKDPIIRPNHPDVSTLRTSLISSGTFHDGNNNASFLSLLPGWILDDEDPNQDSDLQNICHIMGAYFDTLYLQISQIPKLKHLSYTSASHKPIPFAEHLPQSLGLYSPELFIDATVMEKFLNRDQQSVFEGDLHDVKNLIYSNIYNNLTAMYKAKGTEKAIKNIFRCFNIDEKLLRLTINSNREEYTLHSNTQQTLINKNCANFNTASNAGATIYQKSSSLSNWPSRGYITGTHRLNPYGFTMEANVVFPYFDVINDNDFDRRFITSSLFGATTVLDGADSTNANQKGTDTTFPNNRTDAGVTNADVANFQVSFVREQAQGKDGYFVLESKYGGAGGTPPFPTLTSSTFLDVYDNELWNISVRIRPDTYPLAGLIEGDSGTVYPYVVEFHGVNTIGSTIANSFSVSGTMTNTEGQTYNQAGKRIYVGALRNNLTGTIINKTDVLISSVKYWTKYLEDSTLLQHAIDVENIGISGSFLPLSALDSNSKSIINADTLALNWNFITVTSSKGTSADSSGNFSVLDFSSGSMTTASIAAGGPTPGIGKGWIGPVTRIQHPGYGYGFQANASDIVEKRSLNSYRFINPEHVVSEDMIRIFDDEDKMYPPTEFVPNFVYSIEKSPSNAISEEMLDFFAGVVDFNTLIGAPVNRYRHRYKEMEHMRELFFRRVGEVKATEKYLQYYRWFDDAISTLVGQMIPASSEYVDDILNVVENTVLDRPKYQSRFPSLQFFNPDVGGFAEGHAAMMYPSRLGRSTLPSSPRSTKQHEFFWKNRALRDAPEITSGDATVDTQREKFRKTIISEPSVSASFPTVSSSIGGRYAANRYRTRALSRLYTLSAVSESVYHGGVNFSHYKNLGFARASVLPAGPINNEMGVFVPENVLVAFPEDYIETSNFKEVDSGPDDARKIHRVYKVQSGRDWQDGQGYYNMKSTVSFPFNIFSASVAGGYVDQIHTEVTANINITNLHNDVYGPSYEKPLQGPFTEDVVGGLQSRHVPINFDATDTWHDRPEQFKILLGSCLGPPGAIGVVGPDYPWPEANNEGDRPYPVTGSRKAYLFRDMVAKRPVNFKNILITTSSQQGNYSQQYEILNSFGSYQNPRHFIDNQPPLPANAFVGSTRYATQMRTYLDVHRTDQGHVQLLPDYSVAYLTGTKNQNIITTRFSNPGGIKTMGVGYRDIRGNEYSIYNATAYRNIEYLRSSQMPSGTISEPIGAGTTGIRLFDIHGKDIGEIAHRARHGGKFGRDSAYVKENMGYGLTASFAAPRIGADRGPIYVGLSGIYNYTSTMASSLQGWWRLNRNISEAGQCIDSSGNNRHGTFASVSERPSFSTSLYPSTHVQTGSCTFDGGGSADDSTSVGTAATWNAIIGNDTGNGSTEKMTFAAWIYKTGDGENGLGRILDFGLGDVQLYTDSNERIYFGARWDGGNQVQWRTTSTAFSLNAWTHVVVTYDATNASNNPKMYVNGVEQAVALYSGAQQGAYYGIVSQDAHIGNTSANNRTFEGQLADVAVWNSILTLDAIKAIYHSGLTGNTNPNGPGASYDQLPARYKIPRNTKNVIRIANERIVAYNRNTGVVNNKGLSFGTVSNSGNTSYGKLYHSSSFEKDGVSITTTTWTAGMFIKMNDTTSNYQSLLTLGDNGASSNRDIALDFGIRGNMGVSPNLELWSKSISGNKGKFHCTTTIPTNQWVHVAFSWDGLQNTTPTFYVNGVSCSMDTDQAPGGNNTSVNSVGSGQSYIGGTNRDSTTGHKSLHQIDIDEVVIYDAVLTDAEVTTLYSNGTLLNLTSSFAPKTSSLVTWLRLGDAPGDPAADSDLDPAVAGYAGYFYDVKGNNDYIIKGDNGNATYVSYETVVPAVAYVSGTREETIYDTTRKRFDNYNVFRPIPQADIQYLWLARSVVNPTSSNYFGYQPTKGPNREYFSSSLQGLVPFWTFVSASQVRPSSGILGGGFQPIARLGTVALDAVSSSTNTLGFPSDAGGQAYINDTLNVTTNLASASYFNTLLARRQDAYGWTWQMWRTAQYHPILIDEARNSVLSVVSGGTDTVKEFRLPPISLKGRTSLINYDSKYANTVQFAAGQRNNITLRGAHTNEKIFFNEVRLNDLASPRESHIYTPLDLAIDSVRRDAAFAGNWVVYKQNIYPSTRNEFTTRSTTRPGYNNGFWRNSDVARISLATDIPSSFGIGSAAGIPFGSNPGIYAPSRSAWPLDAPHGFLTRSGPLVPQIYKPLGPNVILGASRRSGSAGELQNEYQFSTSSAYQEIGVGPAGAKKRVWRWGNIILSPQYARTHMLSSPRSVVAPSGIDIPETGAIPPQSAGGTPSGVANGAPGAFGAAVFSIVSASEPYGGIALWEAPRNAGIIRRVGKRRSKYLVSASNPWFNDYDSFNADLKLMARGFSTVPEFRISDHMEDYLKYGPMDPGNIDTFNMPGCGITSATSSFYKDYSNSDFLKDVLHIKGKTLYDINEIKITCEAAIRFNPYQGFYPAQRTLDLVSQFSRSYGHGMYAFIPGGLPYDDLLPPAGQVLTGSAATFQWYGCNFRPLVKPLFAPGILYNSIKSGLAVDYPIVTNGEKLYKANFSGSTIAAGYSQNNWALSSIRTAQDLRFPSQYSGSYFDYRIPFEAIVEPSMYIKSRYFIDMEPHPSASVMATASWDGTVDDTYTKMAANFFGEVGNFFLRDKNFTNLESRVVPDNLRFTEGDVFGARLSLQRSMKGSRTYQWESGSTGDGEAFTAMGAKVFIADDPATSFSKGAYSLGSYPLPQDPKRNGEYRENFTMYSRPTAFGPPIAGRDGDLGAADFQNLGLSGSMDCFDGYNWAYTPPYYHGEAWVDFIFRPSATKSYDLEQILAETKVQYWRCDHGPPSGTAPNMLDWVTTLIPGGPSNVHGYHPAKPYSGAKINNNAMQISASFNLFGIERVFKTTGRQGGTQTNETIGAKWIIQPKFETPMMDFGDTGFHKNTSGSGNLSIPLYASASVPRGMWHQFGKMPINKEKGIFLSIADIPEDWLNGHWAVINSQSVYNNFAVPTDESRFTQGEKYKSLSRLFGFDKNNSTIRLGQLAESQEIREAVVAVPYILNRSDIGQNSQGEQNSPNLGSNEITTIKQFLKIPQDFIDSANKNDPSAPKSVSQLMQKMKNYVLPPQFDFISNKQIDPMVMYIFEFKYKLDKDDLSYIWQNLAPRDYQKVRFQKTSVAHEIFDTELLNEQNLIDHPDLRWMVFKVKQKGQKEYWDLIQDQAGEATNQIWGDRRKQPEGYDLAYNWPYDFISFVESIKIDVELMYKSPANTRIKQTDIDITKTNNAGKNQQAQIQVQLQSSKFKRKK